MSYHGIALNIDVDLQDFDLIDPCGMPGLVSTSIAEELGRSAEPPTTAQVERAGAIFAEAFGAAIGAPIALGRAIGRRLARRAEPSSRPDRR